MPDGGGEMEAVKKELAELKAAMAAMRKSAGAILPEVTVELKPSGLPMATHSWPTRTRSEAPSGTVGSRAAPDCGPELGCGNGPEHGPLPLAPI